MAGTHDHNDAPASFGKAFGIGIILDIAFVAIEAVYGLVSDALALLVDPGHDLRDGTGLGIAWAAIVAGRERLLRALPVG